VGQSLTKLPHAPPPDEGAMMSALAGSECRSTRHGPAPSSFAALRRPNATRPIVSLGRVRFGGLARFTAALPFHMPQVQFRHRGFAKNDGAGKLAFTEGQVAAARPVLVSISNAIFGERGWHIMPVVDADSDNLTVFIKSSR
jgi:hypothetical protein